MTTSNVVPSTNARNGILNIDATKAFPSGCTSNGVTGNFNGTNYKQCVIASPDPSAVKYLQFFPLPTRCGNAKWVGEYVHFQFCGAEGFV